jgi:hypothetical protein
MKMQAQSIPGSNASAARGPLAQKAVSAQTVVSARTVEAGLQ